MGGRRDRGAPRPALAAHEAPPPLRLQRLPARGPLVPGAQRTGREAVRLGPIIPCVKSRLRYSAFRRALWRRVCKVLERVVEERPFVLALVPGKMHDEVAGLAH